MYIQLYNKDKYVQAMSCLFDELHKGFYALEWPNIVRQDDENMVLNIMVKNVVLKITLHLRTIPPNYHNPQT